MKSSDIRKQIHQHLDLIEDPEFLQELEDLIQARLGSSNSFEYTKDQLAAIKEGRQQIKLGLGIKNKDLEKDIKKWLKGK